MLSCLDQRRHLRCAPSWPIGLRQQVVNEVTASSAQERQGLVEMGELSRPRVCIDQMKLTLRGAAHKLSSVHHMKRHSRIGSQMPPSHGHHVGLNLDSIETSVGVHTRKKPGNAETGSGPEF